VINKQIELPPGKGTYVQFTVPKGAINVYLSGKTKVVGGILTEIYMGIYYAKDCPTSGKIVYFTQCKPAKGKFYDNNEPFGLYTIRTKILYSIQKLCNL